MKFPYKQIRRKPAKLKQPKHVAGEMNKTEARFYNEFVAPLLASGEVIAYWFESITFQLAPGCRYTPDFVLQYANQELKAFEIKGRTTATLKDGSKKEKAYAQDDAIVKSKVFPQIFPIDLFVCFPSKSGAWQLEAK